MRAFETLTIGLITVDSLLMELTVYVVLEEKTCSQISNFLSILMWIQEYKQSQGFNVSVLTVFIMQHYRLYCDVMSLSVFAMSRRYLQCPRSKQMISTCKELVEESDRFALAHL